MRNLCVLPVNMRHSLIAAAVIVPLIAVVVMLSAETQASLPITIANARVPGGVLIHLADKRGYFEEEGLAADIHTHPLGREAIEELLANTAHLAMAYDVVVLRHLLDGERLRILASHHSSGKANAVIVPRSKGVTNIRDLVGKRVALSKKTSADYFFNTSLTMEGLNPADVVLVDTPPDQLLAVLMNDGADAVVSWEPLSSEIEQKFGKETIRFAPDVYTEMSLLVGKEEYVKEHPEEMERFMRAIQRSESFIETYPEEADEMIAEYLQSDLLNGKRYREVYEWRQRLNNLLLHSLQDEILWLAGGQAAALPDIRAMIDIAHLRNVDPQAVTIN